MDSRFLPINVYPKEYAPIQYVIIEGKPRKVLSTKVMIDGELRFVANIMRQHNGT